jgi:hypothetical protein
MMMLQVWGLGLLASSIVLVVDDDDDDDGDDDVDDLGNGKGNNFELTSFLPFTLNFDRGFNFYKQN